MPTGSGSRQWRVVVLAHPRSGSNSLVEILDRHPLLKFINEPFNEHFPTWAPNNPDYVARRRRGEEFEDILDELWAEFTGLKTLSYQLDDASLAVLIARPDVKVIALHRRNILQTAVSQVVAERTGLWKTWDAVHELEDYYRDLPPLDVAEVARRMEWTRSESRRIDTAVAAMGSDRVLRVDYEDLYESSPAKARALVGDIWGLLELAPLEGDALDHFLSDAVRQARPSTYGQIRNLGEIEAALGDDITGHLPDWATIPS